MQNRMDSLERLSQFAEGNIKLAVKLKRTAAGRYISNQLMRAAASSGANYGEAWALKVKQTS